MMDAAACSRLPFTSLYLFLTRDAPFSMLTLCVHSLRVQGDCGIDLGAVAEACPVLQRLVLLAEPGSSCGAGASPARFEGSHSLSGLSRLTSLTDLTLVPPCGITEPGLRALSCLPALSCLYVSPRAPVDVALLCAAGVPRLASLTLHYAHVARDSGHVHVAADLAGLSTLTRLCVLDFGGLVDLRDATFGALLACCPHLQALVLDNYCVRGAACVDALSRMPELATLGVHSLEPFGSVEPAAGVDASSPHARGGGTERACCAWRHLELSEMPTPEHLVRLPLAGLTELRLPPDLPNACWELGIAGSGADVGATAAHVRGAARVLRPLLSQPLGLLLAWFEAPRVACAAVLASLQPVAHYLEELTLEAWPLGGDTLHALPRVAPHVVGLTLDACGPLAWDGWRALLKMRGLRVLRVRAPVAADDVVAFSLAAAHPVVVYLDAGSLSAEELQRAQQHVHTCRQPPPPPHGAALETATAGSRAGVAWLGMDQVSNTPAYLVNAW